VSGVNPTSKYSEMSAATVPMTLKCTPSSLRSIKYPLATLELSAQFKTTASCSPNTDSPVGATGSRSSVPIKFTVPPARISVPSSVSVISPPKLSVLPLTVIVPALLQALVLLTD
jgi:hypothetical protein